jgi:2-haloacid dehalogenase
MNQGVTRKCNPYFFARDARNAPRAIKADYGRLRMNEPAALLEVDALVFDAYGTLFDVHSVTQTAEHLAPGRGTALSQLWRTKQLEYTWLASLMTTPAFSRPDFAAVTAQALEYALAALSIELEAGDRARLAQAYLRLAPFPDVAAALASLAPRPRWILSNGTRPMLEPLVTSAGLDAHLEGVLSVDDAGIYKPSPRVYALAEERLRLPRARIGFVSSNGWDAAGAKAFGFTTFWINRAGLPVERHGPAPDRTVGTLADLPPLLRRER